MKIDEPTQEPMRYKVFEEQAHIDAFTLAAATDNFDDLLEWISKNIDVNARDSGGETALHRAAYNGRLGAAVMLLDHGALINRPDKQGITPIGLAVLGGQREMAEFLEQQGARVDLPDKKGRTAEDFRRLASELIRDSDKHGIVIPILKENPELVHARSFDGVPLIQYAVRSGNPYSFIAFFDEGADILATDKNGKNTLHIAAQSGNPQMVSIIIQAARKRKELQKAVEAKDSTGATALHYAIASKNLPTAQLLLEAGADVNAQTNEGLTPLMIAAKLALNQAFFLLLAQAGTQFSLKSKKGLKAIDYAEHAMIKEFIDKLHGEAIRKKFRGDGAENIPPVNVGPQFPHQGKQAVHQSSGPLERMDVGDGK
jgi:ankyrin repeat protein